MVPSHPDLPNTQTQPALSFWDQYVPHLINPTQSQSSQAPSSFWDTYAVHPVDQPPPYNSVGPSPPSYPDTQGKFNSLQ
jgi:hypothetical protein